MESKINLQQWGITLVRGIVGLVFVAHGAQKLFQFGITGVAGAMAQMDIPFPQLSAVLVTGTEFLGGLLLLAGLFTRWASLPLGFAMAVAVITVHLPGGFFAPKGVEYPLTLLVASLGLALTGGGAFALDNLLARPAYPAAMQRAA